MLLLRQSLKQVFRATHLLPKNSIVKTPIFNSKQFVPTTNAIYRSFASQTDQTSKPHNHSLHFKIERLWTAGMLPLFPAAIFIHNPTMDFLLATAIALHVHWGFDVVLGDYLEPLGLSDPLKKLAPYFIYAVTIIMYAGMLHFNYNDVGITKAFELIWSL